MAEVEQWLLPTHTNPYPKIKYTYFNKSYGSVTPITTMENTQLLYEHGHMLYMCVPDRINYPSYKWRFYRCSMKTGEIEYICDISSNGPNVTNTSQPSGIICDDLYIYWLNTTNGSIHTLYRMNIDTHIVEDVYNGNVTIRGNIFFISENIICIPLDNKFVFYDTIYGSTETVSSTGLRSNGYCMCKGNNLIVTVYQSTLYWYDINEKTYGTLSLSLSSSNKTSICYENGKFYIVQKGYLSEFNESTKTISSDAKHYISTAPWTSDTLSANICGGLIYIVLYQSSSTTPNTMYIVDKNDFRIYYRTTFGFNVNQSTPTFQICKTATYGDTFFLLKDRICSIRYNPKAKYNVGINTNYVGKDCNKSTKDDFEYDNKYIEFNSTYMTIKNGLIQKEISQFDTDIKQISVNKNEYFKINKIIKE